MKSPQDDRLVKELYEKLNWFTFQAEDEEFDEKQVKAILELLDTLDPVDFEGVEKECMQKEKPRFGIPKREEHSAAKGKLHSIGKTEKPQSGHPAGDADAAFERFQKKYAVTEADLKKKDRAKIIPFTGGEEISEELAPDMEKLLAMDEAELRDAPEADKSVKNLKSVKGKKGRRFWRTAGGRAAIAFLTVFAALAATGICTSAVQQKSFFEVVRDGVNSMKITVTGNEMESQTGLEMESSEKIYYESWDEVKAENPEVVVPGYIPEGLELVELYGKEFGNYVRYTSVYEDAGEKKLLIRVRFYGEEYVQSDMQNSKKYIEEENGNSYYLEEWGYQGYGKKDTCDYTVEWDDLNELKEIMKKME